MDSLVWLILTIIQIYTWIVFAMVVVSWLLAFNVINRSNQFVYMLSDFLNRATEPALSRIRSFIPNMGGIDLSPLVLLLGLYFLRRLIVEMIYG